MLIHARLTLVALTSALFFAPANASAQGRFQPGDRVECDWLQNGSYDKGVVVPFDRNDLDQSGRWFRVKLDKDTIPNSTVECMANRLRQPSETPRTRPAGVPASTGSTGGPLDPGKPPAARFKPGDRVECDKAQIGIWERGTVVPYLPTDGDTASGRYYRVELDGYKLYLAGHECMANFIRPLAGSRSNSGGATHRVGDAVEAQNANNSWLPARIVAIEDGFYKVRFDGRDSRYDETVDAERIRPAGTSARQEAEEAKRDAERRSPPDSGGPAPRVLPGTAWKIDFGSGVTGALYLFCRTGTWQIVHPFRSIGAVGRSYSVSGTTLTTVNRDDGMTRRWRMTWQGDVLTIVDAKETLNLHYNGTTQCK